MSITSVFVACDQKAESPPALSAAYAYSAIPHIASNVDALAHTDAHSDADADPRPRPPPRARAQTCTDPKAHLRTELCDGVRGDINVHLKIVLGTVERAFEPLARDKRGLGRNCLLQEPAAQHSAH